MYSWSRARVGRWWSRRSRSAAASSPPPSATKDAVNGNIGVPIVGSLGGGQWSLWLALDALERVDALVPLGIPAVCLPGFRHAGLRFASVPVPGRLMFGLPSPSARVSGRMLARADARLLDHPELVEAYHAARPARLRGRVRDHVTRCA
jgi:hypothetical protein